MLTWVGVSLRVPAVPSISPFACWIVQSSSRDLWDGQKCHVKTFQYFKISVTYHAYQLDIISDLGSEEMELELFFVKTTEMTV